MSTHERKTAGQTRSAGRGPALTNLTDEQKIYIVRRLAAHDAQDVIARGLKQDFGIKVRLQLIASYNPEREAGRKLSRRWRDLFWRTRKAFKDGTADVGANYPLIRIYWRGEMAQEMWRAGKHGVANDILDSVAKEAGAAPDASPRDGHFGLRGGPLTATVNIVHRQEPAPAPDPARRVRKPDE
jgi:hypothetical protein